MSRRRFYGSVNMDPFDRNFPCYFPSAEVMETVMSCEPSVESQIVPIIDGGTPSGTAIVDMENEAQVLYNHDGGNPSPIFGINMENKNEHCFGLQSGMPNAFAYTYAENEGHAWSSFNGGTSHAVDATNLGRIQALPNYHDKISIFSPDYASTHVTQASHVPRVVPSEYALTLDAGNIEQGRRGPFVYGNSGCRSDMPMDVVRGNNAHGDEIPANSSRGNHGREDKSCERGRTRSSTALTCCKGRERNKSSTKQRRRKKASTAKNHLPSLCCHLCNKKTTLENPHPLACIMQTCRKTVCAKCAVQKQWPKKIKDPATFVCPDCLNVCDMVSSGTPECIRNRRRAKKLREEKHREKDLAAEGHA